MDGSFAGWEMVVMSPVVVSFFSITIGKEISKTIQGLSIAWRNAEQGFQVSMTMAATKKGNLTQVNGIMTILTIYDDREFLN
jgi:hypothetical protein